MKPFEVAVFETKRTSLLQIEPDTYSANNARGWIWVQKLCFWALTKIGCQHEHYVEKIDVVRIDPMNVLDAIYRQKNEAFEHLSRGFHPNQPPMQLYIGAEDYRKMMGDRALLPYIEFKAYGHHNDRQGPRIVNCRITVVPYMTGLLVVEDQTAKEPDAVAREHRAGQQLLEEVERSLGAQPRYDARYRD
jgi:hypothetical protein